MEEDPVCCCSLFAVLIEPVVEGVAVTGFLFFLTPTQYYQQSGDSTQEVSSWDLKMDDNRPFTPIYLLDSGLKTPDNPARASWINNISVLFLDHLEVSHVLLWILITSLASQVWPCLVLTFIIHLWNENCSKEKKIGYFI